MFFCLNRLFSAVIALIILQLLAVFKVNIILGSKSAFFSGFAIGGPLIGVFGGVGLTGAVLLLRSFFIKMVLVADNPFNPLIYHIPTFFASAYWTWQYKLFRIIIPLLCMVLFLAHPVGFAAGVYTLYWWIPVLIAFYTGNSVFLTALGSTFTAHAAGSVLWLYWVPMQPATFISLMPIVLFERVAFACGMTILFYCASWAIQAIKLIRFKNVDLAVPKPEGC
jgi:hypothetical protein